LTCAEERESCPYLCFTKTTILLHALCLANLRSAAIRQKEEKKTEKSIREKRLAEWTLFSFSLCILFLSCRTPMNGLHSFLADLHRYAPRTRDSSLNMVPRSEEDALAQRVLIIDDLAFLPSRFLRAVHSTIQVDCRVYMLHCSTELLEPAYDSAGRLLFAPSLEHEGIISDVFI
jgi:hypothetical protein